MTCQDILSIYTKLNNPNPLYLYYKSKWVITYVLVLVNANHLMVISLVCCVGDQLIDPCLLSLKRKILIVKKVEKEKEKTSQEKLGKIE